MAIRNIVKEGDPILNKVCRPVTNFDDRLATLLDDMRETMIAADGVGLAGPQVGMLRRVFVVWDTTDAPEEIPEDYEYKFIDFVNPEILAVSEDEETAYEGCLSFPGHNAKRLPVKRKETTDAHSVYGDPGYRRGVPEGPVCRRSRDLRRVHPAG